MNNRYITVLDFTNGRIYQYKIEKHDDIYIEKLEY